MKTITPISESQQNQVLNCTHHYIDLAGKLFNRTFDNIPVNFKLTGRAAGMYHVKNYIRYIRYNPYIFSKYFDDNMQNTVPHEVAHYIADLVYGIRNIKPHGKEWSSIMRQFGVEPKVRCDYSLDGVPHYRHRRFDYSCQCRTHAISTRRHNMILKGNRQYFCTSCNSLLNYISP